MCSTLGPAYLGHCFDAAVEQQLTRKLNPQPSLPCFVTTHLALGPLAHVLILYCIGLKDVWVACSERSIGLFVLSLQIRPHHYQHALLHYMNSQVGVASEGCILVLLETHG
jgi:hypothetical protein